MASACSASRSMMMPIYLSIISFILICLSSSAKISPSYPSALPVKQLPNSYSTVSLETKQLRDKGMEYLSKKQYRIAGKYYAAILQLLEGVGGEESAQMRSRCALTLAECEIKTGEIYHAFLTCSDVIEEFHSPLFNDRAGQVMIKQVLGKAYYKRGLSLEKLSCSDLAKKDYEKALSLLPEDRKIMFRLNSLSNHNITTTLNSSHGNITDVYDMIDYIQQEHPKTPLSSEQIHQLRVDRATSKGLGFGSGNILSGKSPSIPDLIALVARMSGMGSAAVDNLREVSIEIIRMIKNLRLLVNTIANNKASIIHAITVFWAGMVLLSYAKR